MPSFSSPGAIGFIGRVKACSRSFPLPGSSGLCPCGRNAGGCQRPGGSVLPESVNAAAVAGWPVHLGWQDVVERRTERADVGQKRSGGFCCSARCGPLPRCTAPARARVFFRNERRDLVSEIMANSACLVGVSSGRNGIYLDLPRLIHLGRAKLLLSPFSGRLARRLALPVGMSHPRPRSV